MEANFALAHCRMTMPTWFLHVHSSCCLLKLSQAILAAHNSFASVAFTAFNGGFIERH
jgi:hypothetical protein